MSTLQPALVVSELGLIGDRSAAGRANKSGPWVRCEIDECRAVTFKRHFEKGLSVCPRCDHHARLSARQRIATLVDAGSFEERDVDLPIVDPLGFVADGQAYPDKVRQAQLQTGEREAAITGSAALSGLPVELVVLEFAFLGASMGSVMGEKVTRAIERALHGRVPLITVNASGGARMHEGVFSLMQLGKTITALAELGAAGVPHISIMTDPTLGGVSASFAGVGDIIIAEKGALVGFAGPRVIEQITKQKLPADAQRAEFLLMHGMADMVLTRRALRPTLIVLLRMYADRGRHDRAMATPVRSRPIARSAGVPHAAPAWEGVTLARRADRPFTLDFTQLIFDRFVELHGDRLCGDDPAIVGGLASLAGRTVMVIGHQRGRNTRENALRRFGMARPEGYRKALRLMHHAERLGIPVVTLIDTPGADPSLVSEEHGQAYAIAENLLAMSRLRVPIVSAIIGEGGSGGAFGLALADRVLMLEHAIYSVASPEAASSILWKRNDRANEAAEALRIVAPDLLRFGVIDTIVSEPAGGAHHDHEATAAALKVALVSHLDELMGEPVDELLAQRTARFRWINGRSFFATTPEEDSLPVETACTEATRQRTPTGVLS